MRYHHLGPMKVMVKARLMPKALVQCSYESYFRCFSWQGWLRLVVPIIMGKICTLHGLIFLGKRFSLLAGNLARRKLPITTRQNSNTFAFAQFETISIIITLDTARAPCLSSSFQDFTPALLAGKSTFFGIFSSAAFESRPKASHQPSICTNFFNFSSFCQLHYTSTSKSLPYLPSVDIFQLSIPIFCVLYVSLIFQVFITWAPCNE